MSRLDNMDALERELRKPPKLHLALSSRPILAEVERRQRGRTWNLRKTVVAIVCAAGIAGVSSALAGSNIIPDFQSKVSTYEVLPDTTGGWGLRAGLPFSNHTSQSKFFAEYDESVVYAGMKYPTASMELMKNKKDGHNRGDISVSKMDDDHVLVNYSLTSPLISVTLMHNATTLPEIFVANTYPTEETGLDINGVKADVWKIQHPDGNYAYTYIIWKRDNWTIALDGPGTPEELADTAKEIDQSASSLY